MKQRMQVQILSERILHFAAPKRTVLPSGWTVKFGHERMKVVEHA